MVWKICIQQLILKNHKISKEGKDPKEIELTKSRAIAHRAKNKKKNSKSAHKHLFFKHRQETQAA